MVSRLSRMQRMPMVELIGLLAISLLAAACGQAGAPGAPDPDASEEPPVGVAGIVVPLATDANAASASDDSQFFCYVEVLTGDRPSIYGYQAPRGCVPASEFRRGELIVWRFVIVDTVSGVKVTDQEAQSVKLRVPDGSQVDAVYKQRGAGTVPDAPWTWDVCWDIPLDYPLGALDYSIIVTTRDGRSGTWKPPALVDASQGIDSRPQIVP